KEHVATINSAVWFVVELAKLTAPCSFPEIYTKRDHADAHKLWDRQGNLLLRADDACSALRELAALTGDACANHGEGDTPPTDHRADLRGFARAKLKGQERAVIDSLCDAGGELLIADLAVKEGVSWDEPSQGFRNVQQRLNPKLKPRRWKLIRQNNA